MRWLRTYIQRVLFDLRWWLDTKFPRVSYEERLGEMREPYEEALKEIELETQKINTMSTQTFFTDNTWANANPSCKRSDMNDEFFEKLVRAREIAGVPFRITSAFRSVEHEKRQGRAGTSAHTLGRAVDIATPDSTIRYHVLRGLYAVGFRRIGINFASNFIHVDDSTQAGHPQDVVFSY